jgi:hypothetical protein
MAVLSDLRLIFSMLSTEQLTMISTAKETQCGYRISLVVARLHRRVDHCGRHATSFVAMACILSDMVHKLLREEHTSCLSSSSLVIAARFLSEKHVSIAKEVMCCGVPW